MLADTQQRKIFPFGLASILLVTILASLLQSVAGASVATTKTANKVQRATIDTTTPRILVPLYIYPTTNAWDPLFSAIRANPTAAFTVIINPNSGPGSSKNPNSDYAAAIKQLRSTAAANQILELVGYVATGYGKRSAAKVNADVSKYAGWAQGVRPDGVFFDETATQSKWLQRYKEYTDLVKSTTWNTVSQTKAKNAKTSQKSTRAQRTGITILNPGTWPEDKDFFGMAADHIVVYEDKMSNFNYTLYKQKVSSNSAGTPNQRSYIFYNVDPNNAVTKDGNKFTLDTLVKATVNGLNAKGGLFVTNLDIASTDVYASFSSIWQQFVKSVASLSS